MTGPESQPPVLQWRTLQSARFTLFGGVLEQGRQVITSLGAPRAAGDADQIHIAPPGPWLAYSLNGKPVPIHDGGGRARFWYTHTTACSNPGLMQLNAGDDELFTVGICASTPAPQPGSDWQMGWVDNDPRRHRWAIFLFGGLLPANTEISVRPEHESALRIHDLILTRGEALLTDLSVGNMPQLLGPVPTLAFEHMGALPADIALPRTPIRLQLKNPTNEHQLIAGALRCRL